MSHTTCHVALLGECMLELQGEAFGAMRQSFGGDTLNSAVYLARAGAGQGVKVSYATGLGTDALSDGLLSRWAEEGLALELVRRLPGRMPGLYQIQVDARGERTFFYWREQSAARAYFESESTPLEAAAATLDVLYFSGISLAILPPAGRERLLQLAQRLRARGAQVVFDNNYRPRLWPDAATALHWYGRTYALCSTALLTLDDEQALRGLGEAEALEVAARLPTPEVVVKRGPAPTLVRTAGQAWVAVPTVPVAQVVDTTAAGDSFGGAYLAARLAGATPAQAAAAGNALAAQVIQHRGALMPR
ncbi:sugar kinase [Ideonella livida]|uniref:2-dehydro-3-deoxygluconokinase n=1 Tax=Ideonella livida TaxID=2707176 RepID=A0A7C9TH34_9BURK|nr:sugar kinase [Ideonella livida]NDY90279.1 sugar kinase [Ideonella livida]